MRRCTPSTGWGSPPGARSPRACSQVGTVSRIAFCCCLRAAASLQAPAVAAVGGQVVELMRPLHKNALAGKYSGGLVPEGTRMTLERYKVKGIAF